MKRLGLALACLVASLTSGCKTGPIYDECLFTVEVDSENRIIDAVADCIRPDKSLYERRGRDLDGMYMYTPESRSNILKWGKAHCKVSE